MATQEVSSSCCFFIEAAVYNVVIRREVMCMQKIESMYLSWRKNNAGATGFVIVWVVTKETSAVWHPKLEL